MLDPLDSLSDNFDLCGRLGGGRGCGMGLRFGTGIGAVFVLLSGGGRGVPGGGKGCPRPMTNGWMGSCSGIPAGFWSPCRCIAFHPHFLAVAAALVIFASEIRLLSVVDDLPEEDVEFSRLGSCPSDPKDLADGASDTNDALLMLAGLGGNLASE
jgi:hypothetical protein